MKLKILALGLLLASSGIAYGQQLQEYIGNDQRSEVILDIKALADGGSVMVGYSSQLDATGAYDFTTNDIIAMRVDNTGAVVWYKRIGTATAGGADAAVEDKLHSVIVDNNGDFVAVGTVNFAPWFETSPNPGYAAIFKFNAGTGAYTANFVVDITASEDEKGSMFSDVIQLDNGDLVAVGANDARPGYSNSMITCFDPNTLAVNWNRIFPISNTDAFSSVDQDNNRIFAAGTYYGTTQGDLQIMEINATGTTIAWHNTYDFALTSGSATNYLHDIQVENGQLMVLTSVGNNWVPNTEFKAGIMRVNMNTGASISLYMFNDNGYSHCNTVAVDYTSNREAYYATNPANSFQWIPVPYTPIDPNFNISDVELAIADPTNGNIADTRVLLHTGEQSISCINISGSDIFYAGVTRNDPVQPGGNNHDIFYVKSNSGLPNNLGNCRVEEGNISDELIQITDGALTQAPNTNYANPTPNLIDYNDPLNVVMLCEEEPCDILDMTWCSSLANPYQYTFNVDTDPAWANVIWNYGDGSPTVSTTAGTPVNHTYTTPGTYTVCVQQLNAAGQVCDEECIDICVADNGGSQKPGKAQVQTSTSDVNSTNLEVGALYPNPTDGILNIPVTTPSGEEVTVRIIRMDGVVMYDAKETLEQGKQTLKVNLGNLSPGNYMCEIRDNKTRNTRMFTKQ